MVKTEPSICEYETAQIRESISNRSIPYSQSFHYKLKRRGEDLGGMSEDITQRNGKRNRPDFAEKQQFKEKSEKTAEDLFFESCSLRMKKLTAASKSLLQLQISQLFYNAEIQQLQPNLQPVSITHTEPVPRVNNDEQPPTDQPPNYGA